MADSYMPFRNITATQFADIWNKFDLDQSGMIEGNELDAFFYELAKSLLKKEPTEEEHASIKKCFMSAYTSEPKISLNTLAKILLHSDEAFLLLFRRKIPLNSSVAFMQIWRKYDKSCNGYINVDELKSFIEDYVTAAGATVTEDKLREYANSIMKLFDSSGDGNLDLQDMARLINVSENFLLQFKIQDGSMKERRRDFEKIFNYYDQSQTGALEGAEIDGFVKDMMETIQVTVEGPELNSFKEKMLSHTDKNKDGKIQKSELALCLGIRLK